MNPQGSVPSALQHHTHQHLMMVPAHPVTRRRPSTTHSRKRHVKTHAKHPERSYDAEDDLDFQMGEEFDRVSNPAKYAQYAQHLELMWNVSRAASNQRSRPCPCECCRGSGEVECSFCHGTGALTLGDTLYCSDTGCQPCPACKSKGYVRCLHCTGTGFRASWMTNEGCPTP